jgi:putative methyltransferase (TIGR04325 family)
MSDYLLHTINRLRTLPGVLQWRKCRFDRRFESGREVGNCRGLFNSYRSAAGAAPPTRPLGYDNAAAAAMYRERLDRIYPSDYPMMLWLQRAFDDGVRRVLDLGGHVGIAFYAYQKFLPFPDEVHWTVSDVPAVVRAGRALARERAPSGHLHFTEDFSEAASADLLFTSGCLQYLPETLGERLAALPQRPRWLLVNLLPLHEEWAYWTLQSIGTAYCPYRIQHAATFFGELEALGYRVIDRWDNLEKRCWIAFEPEHSLDRYCGAVLRLD